MLLLTMLSIHLFKVAEFGGTLSLFLGFSFMTLWDGICNLRTAQNMGKRLMDFFNKVKRAAYKNKHSSVYKQ